uniref:7TM_GPCR_Srx domain-containing protein n=1 Tax=Panagrellus redivivus TaxID=6233 RepID=A0A7E4VLL2_PANRE
MVDATTSSSIPTTSTKAYYHVTDKDVSEYSPSIYLYEINIIVGSCCFVIAVINFTVLCSTKKFRSQYMMLITLSVTEMCALMGIILEATTRRELFIIATATRLADVMTSRTCLLPWILFQVTGDFWSPAIVLLMGLERMCAVVYPTIFRTVFNTETPKLIALASGIAGLFVLIPTLISAIWPTQNVRWSCGRRATFGVSYGMIDYAYNVILFSLAFVFNLIALIRALKVRQSGRNMSKLKCYTAISFLSTLLIAIPNLLSIINVFWTLPDMIITPAPLLACANGAIQFGVYLTFNAEYRRRFLQLVTFNQIEKFMPKMSVTHFTTVPINQMSDVTTSISIQQQPTSTKAYYHVTDKDVSEYSPSIYLYQINIVVGSTCFVIAFLNFAVLCSSKKFRSQYIMSMTLSVTQMFSLMGIILEATTRRELFINATATRLADIMTSRTCLLPWIQFQVIGDFWCPTIVLLMGIERMCAVVYPTIFRTVFNTDTPKLIAVASGVPGLFVLIPTMISAIWPMQNVRWSCGRKAAYGYTYGMIDYAYNVILFSLAFIFNFIALVRALKVRQSGRSMSKLKCYTAISFLSTLLIAIPNLLSIINVFWTLPDMIITPAPLLACANGAIQFGVYLTFNAEYRRRFLQLVTFNQIEKFMPQASSIAHFTTVPRPLQILQNPNLMAHTHRISFKESESNGSYPQNKL